jgi:hypothetical protein
MTESRAASGVDLEKIRITGRDWDMSDWLAGEITVEGIVMPLEGCGANEDGRRSYGFRPGRSCGSPRPEGRLAAQHRVDLRALSCAHRPSSSS